MRAPPDPLPETHHAVSGRARLTVGEAGQAAGPGSHSIEERRVLFAPAESAG